MPNWCMNCLYVEGKAEVVRDLVKRAKGKGEEKKSHFSFGSFLPTPPELMEKDGMESGESLLKTGKFSDADWYGWRVNHWGTKWDVEAQAPSVRNGRRKGWLAVTYDFDSAWAQPEAGILAISELFPTLTFTLTYDEPGMDFGGRTVFKAGEVIDSEKTESPSAAEMREEEEAEEEAEGDEAPTGSLKKAIERAEKKKAKK